MKDYLIIAANGPYYQLFYNLAFFVALIILLIEGYKRNFPMLKWILLLAFTRLLFIFGSKIVTYSPEEWGYMFTNFSLPATLDKSLLGGLLFGAIGLFGAKYLLQFKQNFLDTFAIVLPLAIGIQRIGCFLTGCCYGTVSNVSWAVKYPVNTLPHFHQFESGLISNHDLFSLPVHPVQLYELIGTLIIVGLVIRFRKSFMSQGSLFLFSFILLILVRFSIEFFRDPLAHTIGGRMFWILNTTQLAILLVAIFLLWILVRRESVKNRQVEDFADQDLNLTSSVALLFILSSVLWTLRNWLSISELYVMLANIIAALTLIGYRLIRNYYFSPYRWLYLASLILPLLLMSQTMPVNEPDSVLAKTYKSIGLGVASGNYSNSQNIGTGEGCDRISDTQYFKQQYTIAGGGFSFTREIPAKTEQLNYGINAYVGRHSETRYSDQVKDDNYIFGINPYINYDRKWGGIGGGLHIGDLRYTVNNTQKDGTGIAETGSVKTPVFPQVYARFGPKKYLFVDYKLADNFPTPFPGISQKIGIGSGFGLDNGFNLQVGSTFSGTFISGYIPVKNRILIQPLIVWADQVQGEKSHMQYSFGLSYRFDHHEKMIKHKTYQPPVGNGNKIYSPHH